MHDQTIADYYILIINTLFIALFGCDVHFIDLKGCGACMRESPTNDLVLYDVHICNMSVWNIWYGCNTYLSIYRGHL
jgi:hypothetical protein